VTLHRASAQRRLLSSTQTDLQTGLGSSFFEWTRFHPFQLSPGEESSIQEHLRTCVNSLSTTRVILLSRPIYQRKLFSLPGARLYCLNESRTNLYRPVPPKFLNIVVKKLFQHLHLDISGHCKDRINKKITCKRTAFPKLD
jgi:hypothetical protein